MDTSFVERLEKRARTMLPAAAVMAVECRADATGDPRWEALLAEIQEKGRKGEPLCAEPYELVVFEDRVLLRCGGCPRGDTLPQIAGVGYGRDEAEARRNALYALTLPADRPNAREPGCFRAHVWGEGPVRAVVKSCVFDRVAYAGPSPV